MSKHVTPHGDNMQNQRILIHTYTICDFDRVLLDVCIALTLSSNASDDQIVSIFSLIFPQLLIQQAVHT